ncbi:MAG: ABC transporter permease subunit [Planctomycetota bacterium]
MSGLVASKPVESGAFDSKRMDARHLDSAGSVSRSRFAVHSGLIAKYVSGCWLLWAACGLAMFAFAWVRVWVVSLLDMSQFQSVLEQFRQYERFAPIDFDSLLTYTGRVGMTYDEPIIIFCTVIWCVARGSDVVAGELNRGTMEMILAQPIRRSTLLNSHALVSVLGLAGLCLLVWLGIAIGIQVTAVTESGVAPSLKIPFLNWEIPIGSPPDEKTIVPLRERVDAMVFLPATVNLFAFGFFLLGLSSLLSSIDRYRWRAIGMVIGIYVCQLVLYGLGKAAGSLQWLLSTSFFSCYKAQKMTSLVHQEGFAAIFRMDRPLADGMLPPLIYPLLLIAMGAGFYAAAKYLFEKRDLPAPL